MTKKLKRAIIKEELVELTGNYKKAIVLNQMIYWSERMADTDKYLEDEKKRSSMAMGTEEIERAQKLDELDLLSHGWIYKSATDLSNEVMMAASKTTIGNYLEDLVQNGWLKKRKNPKWKGDNTYQYRVDLIKIQTDLYHLGYSLEGYTLFNPNEQSPSPENELRSPKSEYGVQFSDGSSKNWTTLPEITSEIYDDDDKIYNDPIVKINQLLKTQDHLKPLFKILKEATLDPETTKNILEEMNRQALTEYRMTDVLSQLKYMKEEQEAGESYTHFHVFFVNGLLKRSKHSIPVTKQKQREKSKQENRDTSFYYNWLEDDDSPL